MTPQGTGEQDTAVAAGWFAGIMTLAAGGAGLLVAGLVLGLDYLLHGEPSERGALSEQRARNRQRRYRDALDWLEADRTDRERARKAKRDWFEGDPTTRGDAPSSGETIGRALCRAWNWLLVGVVRFWRGWKKGRTDARKRRDAGQENWWRRPDDDPRPELTPPREPEPSAGPAPQPNDEKPPDDVVEAEIVPDGADVPDRQIVPVGADGPVRDPGVNGYATQLDELQHEVEETRTRADDDPSPQRSRLH